MCMFPTNSERLIGISDAFSAFCLRVSVILPTCSLYPQQKRAYSALHPQAWTYRSMLIGTYRTQSPGFPKIVYRGRYSGTVKFLQNTISEWRWQRRRAGLRADRQFQIFRHGPIIVYTRLPAARYAIPDGKPSRKRKLPLQHLIPLPAKLR